MSIVKVYGINPNSIPFSSSRFQIMKIANTVLGDKLFTKLMKATFYGHFVAGEDEIKIVPTLERY